MQLERAVRCDSGVKAFVSCETKQVRTRTPVVSARNSGQFDELTLDFILRPSCTIKGGVIPSLERRVHYKHAESGFTHSHSYILVPFQLEPPFRPFLQFKPFPLTALTVFAKALVIHDQVSLLGDEVYAKDTENEPSVTSITYRVG